MYAYAADGFFPGPAFNRKKIVFPVKQLQAVADIENTAAVIFTLHIFPLLRMVEEIMKFTEPLRRYSGACVFDRDEHIRLNR